MEERIAPSLLLLTVFTLWLLLAVAGCGCVVANPTEGDTSRHLVAVSIPPLRNFTEMVGGERVEVVVMLPPGAEPHSYEPSAGDIIDASQAELVISIGTSLPFEQQFITKLQKIRPGIVVVNTSAGIPLMNGDPHIWLSPRNAKVMVRHITSALCDHDHAHCKEFQVRQDVLLQDLDALNLRLHSTLAPMEGTAFLVTHPAWGYFAEEYHLTQIAIEEEGKEPTSGEIAALISTARTHHVRVVLVEPQFSPREAEVVARQINGTVIQVDPLSPAYIPNLEYVAAIIRSSAG